MEVPAEEDRERAVADLAGPREREPGRADEVVHRPREQEDGGVVEHDRRDHFVSTGPCFQEPGNETERRTAERARHSGEDDADRRRRLRQLRADHGRGERSDEELPRDPDIEETGLETEAHGEAAEDQRRRGDERVCDRGPAAEGPSEKVPVRGDRKKGLEAGRREDARHDDDHGSDDEGEHDREERNRRDLPDLSRDRA